MGPLHKCRHWLEELSQPIRVTEQQISKDLAMFSHQFPLDLVPHKSDIEIALGKLERDAKRLEITLMHYRHLLKEAGDEESQRVD